MNFGRKAGESMDEKLYSIGQASKICDVSQRMLRYYEEIGLIAPDYIAASSRFRYYTVQTMQQVQNIRYLIDQGFNLEEIKEVLAENDLHCLQEHFLKKIRKAQDDVEYYCQRLDCVQAWYALLVEGCVVALIVAGEDQAAAVDAFNALFA